MRNKMIRTGCGLMVATALVTSVWATSYTWNGYTNNNWTTQTNWEDPSCEVLPCTNGYPDDTSDDATICEDGIPIVGGVQIDDLTICNTEVQLELSGATCCPCGGFGIMPLWDSLTISSTGGHAAILTVTVQCGSVTTR